jgi:6-pyruvoyltetrahydropterin/6-carboxytetrahydropterin synthase
MKRILMEKIHDPLDHGFMVWKDDQPLRDFLEEEGYKVVVMERVPTAENLARWIYEQTHKDFVAAYGNRMRLKSITVWETPTSSAIYAPEE